VLGPRRNTPERRSHTKVPGIGERQQTLNSLNRYDKIPAAMQQKTLILMIDMFSDAVFTKQNAEHGRSFRGSVRKRKHSLHHRVLLAD
jgi:hypothetical protein